MPRTTHQPRYRLFLPDALLCDLTEFAVHTNTPIAELLRRIADLAATFHVPSDPSRIPIQFDNMVPFTLHIPDALVDELSVFASSRGQTPFEAFSFAAQFYLLKKAYQQSGMARKGLVVQAL